MRKLLSYLAASSSLQTQVQAQAKRILELEETIRNQYERHSNQIAQMRRDIDRLRGVHGA